MYIQQFFPIALIIVCTSVSNVVSAQDKPDLQKSVYPIQVAHMAFRPAKWEEKLITEEINEKRNEGGLLFVYYTNVSENPIDFREWYLNDRESGHYRLAGDVAWDRRYTDVLQPGETTVQEICGVSKDFQTGKQADFSIIGRNWQPICFYDGQLEAEKWRISSITFDTTLTKIYLHIRSFIAQTAYISSISVLSKEIESMNLTDTIIEGSGHVIAELILKKPFIAGELAILKLDLRQDGKTESLYSHRNAYADFVPNGTWGIEEKQYADAKQHHLNTMVRGGHSADLFFSKDFKTTGFRTMTHTGLIPNVDMLRNLEDHPAVACWYIHDEPDWLYTPQLVLTSHAMTKKYSAKKPTLITLCRNVKFFEYAFIPDIPCHDHYSVTAPSSSKWPYPYGTRLEETGYYTADLKYASEPKPIWVWSQGVHLWDERPKMPLPTPDELGAQLYFNLGRGAKGNLWFTFMEEAGKKYPATKSALQQYSRVVRLLEHDLLRSDPWHGTVQTSATIDVACLLTPDKAIYFITNTDYMIHDSAYQWRTQNNVKLKLLLPPWFHASDGFEIHPVKGIVPVSWSSKRPFIDLELEALSMGSVIVISQDKKAKAGYEDKFKSVLAIESKE